MQSKIFNVMKMITKSFNKKSDIDDFVNAKGIKKDDLVTIYQDIDETYVLVYYGE